MTVCFLCSYVMCVSVCVLECVSYGFCGVFVAPEATVELFTVTFDTCRASLFVTMLKVDYCLQEQIWLLLSAPTSETDRESSD